ncbi:hypothetical protein RSSL_00770 [Streptococcus salivarius K12]|uniref:Uncharacterized protein n=1 Tax=Streptococcus salivarius K12 TaxID=1200793 RepID=J7SHT0_STRSL|nr:hypothetical protein RSSL_00770 [Streptococcus salivarius K12]
MSYFLNFIRNDSLFIETFFFIYFTSFAKQDQ